MLKESSVALVISDLRLPDLDGIALLKQVRELLPEAEVVMITGHGSVEKAVEAMRLGAYDFIQKPLDSAALLKTVAKALEKQRLASENRQLAAPASTTAGRGRAHRRQPGDAGGQKTHPPDCAHGCQRAHPGRERHGQGNRRRCAACI